MFYSCILFLIDRSLIFVCVIYCFYICVPVLYDVILISCICPFIFIVITVVCLSLKLYYCIFFLFKQKTAYDVRIIDWSSDVCSSDLFGLFFRGHDGRGAGMAGLLAVLVAPFAAMIVQMAISRTREYGADRAGGEISGNPRALASALRKIAGGAARIPNPVTEHHPAAAQLYIVPTPISQLFSHHPAPESRIAAREEMDRDLGIEQATGLPPTKRKSAL